MLFNSYGFLLIFLPIAFAGYWFLFPRLRQQNVWVVAVSWFFYGLWDWRFLGLIIAITIGSYLVALGLARSETRRVRRWLLALGIVLALAVLGFFKYFGFFIENLQALTGGSTLLTDWATLNIVLPVGISFYTFQAMGYMIDVYRRNVEACRDLVAFSAFISFFPQLVAGPIERAGNLLPQFLRARHFHYEGGVEGCRLILWGLFKKIVIADSCGYAVNQIWEQWATLNSLTLWVGALLFAFQIYGDFSGYSDIAIGLGRLFGIHLNWNFRYPYLSRTPKEFWTRWHISLSSWFRDYFYIPLGGNRKGKLRKLLNVWATFVVSGLWHGAAWTFVAWGALHGAAQTPEALSKRRSRSGVIAQDGRFPTWGEGWLWVLTFLVVVLFWVPFRAPSVEEFFGYVGRMFTEWGGGIAYGVRCLPWILLLLGWEWAMRRRSFPLDFQGHGLMRYGVARWTLYLAIFATMLLFHPPSREFIYFQF